MLDGFSGSQTEWLASLVGADGTNGTDGEDGTDGTDGDDGASAYELAVADGFSGSQTEWLASLVGADGTNGTDGEDGTDGTDGDDGASAYELAVDDGFSGSQTEWLASLVGTDGADGADGAAGTSAFEIWLSQAGNENGTEQDFLNLYLDNTDDQALSLTDNELSLENGGAAIDLSSYLDNTDDQTGAEVSVTPTGNLQATTVQAALAELQGDIDSDAGGDMSKLIYDTDEDGTVDNAATVNNLEVLKAVPADADFTDDQTGTEVNLATPLDVDGDGTNETTVEAAIIQLNTDLDGKSDLIETNIESITALENTKENAANKSTDTSLGGTDADDTKFPTQLAVKTYVDAQAQAQASGSVADEINDATVSVAPSQNAVFDALADKEDALRTNP